MGEDLGPPWRGGVKVVWQGWQGWDRGGLTGWEGSLDCCEGNLLCLRVGLAGLGIWLVMAGHVDWRTWENSLVGWRVVWWSWEVVSYRFGMV